MSGEIRKATHENNLRNRGYRDVEKIGQGAFAMVLKAKRGNDWLAIKCQEDVDTGQKEYDVWSKLDDENIVKCLTSFTAESADVIRSTLTVQREEGDQLRQVQVLDPEGDEKRFEQESRFITDMIDEPDVNSNGMLLNVSEAALQLGIKLMEPNDLEEEACKSSGKEEATTVSSSSQKPEEVNACLDALEEVESAIAISSQQSEEAKTCLNAGEEADGQDQDRGSDTDLNRSKDAIGATGDHHGQPASQERFHYLVMELCDMTLSDFLRGMPDRKKLMPMYISIVKGVAICHSKKIVHRDLNADNIFIKDDMAKIGDFGNAEVMEEEDMFRLQVVLDINALGKLAILMLVNPVPGNWVTYFCKAVNGRCWQELKDPEEKVPKICVLCNGQKYTLPKWLFDIIKDMIQVDNKSCSITAKDVLDCFVKNL